MDAIKKNPKNFKGLIFNVFSVTLSFWLTLCKKSSTGLHKPFYVGTA